MTLLEKILAALAVLLMTGALWYTNNEGTFAKPEFDRTSVWIPVKVSTFTSRAAYEKALVERKIELDSKGSRGRSVWAMTDLKCEVFQYRPSKWTIDSGYTMTLGHEMEHCLYGEYHIETIK